MLNWHHKKRFGIFVVISTPSDVVVKGRGQGWELTILVRS